MEATALIRQLAQARGIPLSPRSVSGGHVWDGRTLGLHYQRWAPDEDAPVFAIPKLLPELHEIMAEDLCHEMAHYCLAPSWIRDLPEYGLMVPAWDYTNANGGYHLHRDDGIMEGLLPEEEQNFLEERVRLLGIYFCYRTQIPTTSDIRHWNPTFAAGGIYAHVPQWVSERLNISVRELQEAIAWTNAHPRTDINPKVRGIKDYAAPS